eukprot:2905674-Rhodomonas_salina.1
MRLNDSSVAAVVESNAEDHHVSHTRTMPSMSRAGTSHPQCIAPRLIGHCSRLTQPIRGLPDARRSRLGRQTP